MAEIAGRAAPRHWDPLPRHGQSPGALIAFRPDIYDAIGGFEPLPCREDRLIARRLVECGFRVARPWDAVVFASCRLRGRAPGGMADTIADRTRTDLARATDRLERQTERLRHVVHALRVSGPAALIDLGTLLNERQRDVLPLRQIAT